MHERYGADHSALVAAFPTYRARGAIRELGKALGLPPGEIERVARSSEAFSARAVDKDIATALGDGAPGRRPLGLAAPPRRRGARAAAPPQPALGRDDRRDPPADRLLRGRARRDGGPADGHVGQGLLRGRGLPEDRPARAGDAERGRALRRADPPRGATSASTSRGSPTTTSRPTTAIQNAETTGVFQIESRAQMGSLLRTRPETLEDLTIQVAIVRPGPIQGGAVNPYIARLQALRANPSYEVPYDHPCLEEVLKETLGTIIFQDQVIEVAMAFAGFSPGQAEGLRRAMSRKRSAEALGAFHRRLRRGRARDQRRGRRDGRARLDDDRRLLGLRLPQGPRRGVRPAGLPVDLAARALRAGVPVLAARRAADGLLPARRAGPRGAAARDRGAGAGREPQRGRAARWSAEAAPRCGSASATCSACAPTRSPRWSPSASPAGRSRRWATSPRAPGAGRPALETLAWSGACDALADGDRRAREPARRRTALWQLGVAAPAAERVRERARSSRCRWSCPPRRRSIASAAGTR